MTQNDIQSMFINSLGDQLPLSLAIEMNLVKPETMRNYLIVHDIQKRLQEHSATFYNILFELEPRYGLSVRQLARIYNNNRHFLKIIKSSMPD